MLATVPLLHIDHSALHRLLIKEAIALTRTPFALFQADGLDAAVDYFEAHKVNQAHLCPRPALVLLDYGLGGRRTGCKFLEWLRLINKNTATPVVIFSSSSGKRDVEECYATGANHFLLRPQTMDRFKAIVSTLFISLTQPRVILQLPECISDPRYESSAARHQWG